MSLKYGKKQIEQMAAVLDGDYGTVNEAAFAALEMAEQIFEDRAKFVVVGQLAGSKLRNSIPPDDAEAIKVSLGWYSTEGDAIKAAESLWFSTASGDTFRTWPLPVFHGSPAQFHANRKQHYIDLAAKAEEKRQERVTKQNEAFKAAQQKRADEIQAIERAASGQHWPCPSNRVKAGECLHTPPCK